MEDSQEIRQAQEINHKAPAIPAAPSEPLILEDLKAPEFIAFPPAPKQKMASPYNLSVYYEYQTDKAMILQERLAPIYDDFVQTYPSPEKWIKYSEFYESLGFTYSARSILRRAAQYYRDRGIPRILSDATDKFYKRQAEFVRIYTNYTAFQTPFAKPRDRSEVEDAAFWRIKFDYAWTIYYSPREYHLWIRYIDLLKFEDLYSYEDIKEIYQMGLSKEPLQRFKRYWVDYVQLGIKYARSEEEAGDIESCREIYKNGLDSIPHPQFTFCELWLVYVQLEIGQGNLELARDFLRKALKVCPKERIHRPGIPRHVQLVELNSCKELFEKYLELEPEDCSVQRKYEKWKTAVGDFEENVARMKPVPHK
ncbi:crooked neck-like protein 1 [Diachasma alloeum]|uniref:crooked neck-like protein 1 n=1 Tax=Diachasma alloeum TaxID=454923 RepID=UPI000738507F|nr:crooked neck-like protein 1 [Diachasma alloeum]